MADPNNTRGAPPREVHIEKKKTNWLAWILLGLGILAALLALSRCHKREAAVVAPVTTAPAGTPATPPVAVQHITLPGGKVVDLAPKTLNYDLQAFLASSDPAPRTFNFDNLNFDTASSQIRTEDQPTLSALSQILAAYPKATVRLVRLCRHARLGCAQRQARQRSRGSGRQGTDRWRYRRQTYQHSQRWRYQPGSERRHRGRPVRKPPHRTRRHEQIVFPPPPPEGEDR